MKFLLALACSLAAAAHAGDVTTAQEQIAQSQKRWQDSPHGPMLERLLPPTFDAKDLPQPGSEGARLVARYCVQCHNLPNPAMHSAARWPSVVERMVPRMQGRGNMGKLMQEMMAGVSAPQPEETRAMLAYLQRHAQRPLDPARYPEVNAPSGEAFRLACSQCHVLPDPKRHSAAEWRAVVARMQRNMEWMNRVVGTRPALDRAAGEPQLRVDEINAFLARYARR